MVKQVIITLADGDFEQGFAVSLRIQDKDTAYTLENGGRLPGFRQLLEQYEAWQTNYNRLRPLPDRRWRDILNHPSDTTSSNDCRTAVRQLRLSLNHWYNAPEFGPIKDKLLTKLSTDDEIQLIIRTKDIRLQRLPWHLFFQSFLNDHAGAELAISLTEHGNGPKIRSRVEPGVRVLAVFGSSLGINLNKDRTYLESLQNSFRVELVPLVEPNPEQLIEHLCDARGWDIFFFAGHSASQMDGEEGWLEIKPEVRLPLDETRETMKEAINRGLRLAIFNSCDGLGLARQLSELNIAQIVVMRDSVPDAIAQNFLRNLLDAFPRQNSLYLSVREARNKLESHEYYYPGATGLPVIFQNPELEAVTWQQLSRQADPLPRLPLLRVLVLSIAVAAMTLGIRQLGMLETWELQAYDQLLRRRPDAGPDPRLLIVKITEEDIQNLKQWPLSDSTLAQLLKKIEQNQPQSIGLDIYRDYPVEPGHRDLVPHLSNQSLIAVCKASETDRVGTSPLAVLKDRLGFSDVVVDNDGVLRRHLFYMSPAPEPCNPTQSFSLKLALDYLISRGVEPKVGQDGSLQLGATIFKRLESPTGGYHQLDSEGHQLLLNYRSPQNIAHEVTLSEVLNDQVKRDWIKNRIVLIGVTATSIHDDFPTPYSSAQLPNQKMSGVLVHAQMVSQILSAAAGERPLLWVWPVWGENLWTWGWSVVGGMLAWRSRSWLYLTLTSGAIVGLCWLCFELLVLGGWVPLVPAVLTLIVSGIAVVIYTRFWISRLSSSAEVDSIKS